MTAQVNTAPVIIKRKKVIGGGGHHGGAWKVAYADFVTAMMAFFMLMWLLNATTEKQRKGLADYFSPTISISRISGGGDGALSGHSVFSEQTLPQVGTGASNLKPTEGRQARGELGDGASDRPDDPETAGDAAVLAKIESLLLGRGGESAIADARLQHIITRVTDEGVTIELFALPERPLFDAEDSPTDLLRDLAQILSDSVVGFENPLTVEAHVPANPVVARHNPVWERSMAQADAMRQLLITSGTETARIQRVTGHGDREPVSYDTMATRNNRLEVVLLRLP